MARPHSTTLTITECPGRPKPWRVRWWKTTRGGDRRRVAKFFATEAEAEAFKAVYQAPALAPHLAGAATVEQRTRAIDRFSAALVADVLSDPIYRDRLQALARAALERALMEA